MAITQLLVGGDRRLINVNEGVFKEKTLKEWIVKYLSTDEDLSTFLKQEHKDYLEIVDIDFSKGYVFCGEEERMQELRRTFSETGRRTIRYFSDLEVGLAGFLWRKEK